MISPRSLPSVLLRPALVCSLAALSALLPGCTDEDGFPPPPPTREQALADLPEVQINVRVEYGNELLVRVHYHGAAVLRGLGEGSGMYCPTVTQSFAVTLDGAALPISNPGGWVPDGLGSSYDCLPPTVRVRLTPDQQKADSVLIVRDDSQTFTVPLGDLLVARAR